MGMLVVDVRVVLVGMDHRVMAVPVRVFGSGWRAIGMNVPMVLVMVVRMAVLQRLVRVLVPVAFRQMQPHADGHQDPGQHKLKRERLTQQTNGQHSAKERRN